MEIDIRRNIKKTGRKILSPLKNRRVRYIAGTITGIGVVLYSLPLLNKNQAPLFDASAKCEGSTPVLRIQGDIQVEQNQIYWLVAEEIGSRRFRVLEKNNGSRWVFNEVYRGYADPRSKYTEIPIGKFVFHKSKEYDFSIYSGGYSSRRTPLLDQRQHRIRQKIPSC